MTSYFSTQQEALEEANRLKSEIRDEPIIVRCGQTGYGTWKVWSVPAELAVETLAEGPSGGLSTYAPIIANYRRSWGRS